MDVLKYESFFIRIHISCSSISKFCLLLPLPLCRLFQNVYNSTKQLHMKNYFVLLLILFSTLFASCEDEDVVVETSIQYNLTISPDLLKFVTPQVQYVDENGVLVTITGVQELDGLVLENKAEISGDGGYASAWTQQIITGTGYKCWTINMRFRHTKFHSYMAVKYIPNDFIEDTAGKAYDLYHTVNTSVVSVYLSSTSNSSTAKAYSDSHISVSVGDYHAGDDLELYISTLSKNPDKVGYYIDEDGVITRKDDFNI